MSAGSELDWRSLAGPDESILWEGRPHRWAYVVRQWPLTLLGIPFLGFAFIWMQGAGALGGRAGSFSTLFGVPFVLAGLYLVVGHYAYSALVCPTVRYILTDRRLIISAGFPIARSISIDLGSIQAVEVTEGLIDRRLGTGSITVITPSLPLYAPPSQSQFLRPAPTLAALCNPHDVASAIRSAIRR